MPDASTVFVVDDDRSVCDSVRWLVCADGFLCETYGSAESMLSSFVADRPGCLVVDLRLPGQSGLELLESLPSVPVKIPSVILTGYGDVASVVRATKAGAVGFLEKPFDPGALMQQVREAVAIDRTARDDAARRNETIARLALLTSREREVMEMIVTGKANKDIAAILHRSQKTVESHRRRVMKKMRAGNVADLVRLVVGEAGMSRTDVNPGIPSGGPPPQGVLPASGSLGLWARCASRLDSPMPLITGRGF